MLASVTIVIRKSMKLSDLSFWASDVWFKNFLSLGGPCHMEGYWQFPRVGRKGQQPEVIKECLKLNWYFHFVFEGNFQVQVPVGLIFGGAI